ncbi:SusC/RagA family TonB-linked outer membrane protein [Pedobacter helvus]|uniref:SusC/RagA family TonB-linked outer membrane protein n=1 Tax=Pedobacter helvus TaxID=2563444 RepID=A0ABW9JCU8_9SPHI|nr:SusC/RagA family TonB-linked outer membrane protein [Pedobacter ureilyticus]
MNFNDRMRSKSVFYGTGWPVVGKDCPGMPGMRSAAFKRVMMRVNLIVFFLTAMLMQVSALTRAQVSLNEQKTPLLSVIKSLKKQSGYHFFYNDQNLKEARPVTLSLKNVSLEEALKACMEGQELTYTIAEKTVVIKAKQKSLLDKAKSLLLNMVQDIEVQGVIRDEKGVGLPGATIRVKGTERVTRSNEKGEFVLSGVPEDAVLVISYLGYQTLELKAQKEMGNIGMAIASGDLEEVNVMVNTGFQTLNKERATGSFTKVDNELLNRRVGSTLIERLEGVTSGLMFNANVNLGPSNPNGSAFNIRGLSTIFANTKPLIVIDNFPFDGDLSNINPNDVEDVTVLKDAAAASIWGAKSGNGVIVITTKKGKLSSPLNINFNSNVTLTEKPDIYYDQNFLHSSSFIDAEQFLFSKGYYNSNITNVRKPTLSPIVEILLSQRNGNINETQAKEQMDVYRNYDFRDGLSKYFYQSTAAQQYSLNLSGGSDKVSYYFSAGYDDVPSVNVGNSYSRMSLNSNTTFRPIKYLEATVGIMHIIANTQNNNPGNINPGNSRNTFFPYALIADENGNSLPLPKDYRLNYIQSLSGSNLLDWQYRPLDELSLADNTGKSTHTRLNASLKYTFIPGLSAEVRYQLENQNASNYNLQSEQSYFTRNLINLNTQVGGGTFTYGVPRGGILDQDNREMTSHSIRAQLNLDRKFGSDHEVTAIVGIDGKEVVTDVNAWRLYGFKDHVGTSTPVNYEMNYPKYGNLAASSRITYVDRYNKLSDIYFSYFGNTAYTFKDKYTVSSSARIDQSNLFGVNTNQKSVPLWSVGGSWMASKESFLQKKWIDMLKFRTTFGYNGNIDRTVSAYATGSFSTGALLTGLPFVSLQTAPNPELRWERIAMLNLGMDFSVLNGQVFGSFEYYKRKGEDMLGYSDLDPTTGMSQFKGNVANITGSGFDGDLTFRVGKSLRWSGNLLFSITTDQVIQYKRTASLNGYMQTAGGELGATATFTPIVGQPIYGIYSYPWGGLDPDNGDPLIRTADGTNKDYSALLASTDFSQLAYHGTARPTHFGGFRNSLTYKGVSVSVNVTYKFDYYFRRSSIDYTSLAGAWLGHPDYDKRWQVKGDELMTNVPSFTYPLNTNRNGFYRGSEVLVEKGDHIRLQDLRIGYDVRLNKQSRVRYLNLYAYANNIGILWKSTKTNIDPDFITNRFVNPTTYALGVNCGF